jgi:hypothetical protein
MKKLWKVVIVCHYLIGKGRGGLLAAISVQYYIECYVIFYGGVNSKVCCHLAIS